MANNNAKADVNMREVIAEWIFQEFWRSETLPSDTLHMEYTKILMNVAAADGVLADAERKWILGNLAAKGGSDQIYKHFATYTPSEADLQATITQRPTFTQVGARALVFDAFTAASADKELHPAERKAIYQVGRTMGIDDTLLQQIEQASADEKKRRTEIVALLFPEGLKKACDDASADFKQDQS